MKSDGQKQGRISRLYDRASKKAMDLWSYCSEGVWEDHRDSLKVKLIKTANLTVRTFMSSDLQSKACAMTYRTMLAVVPALALVFAIGRGFGFQNLLQNQLYNYLPSQRKALEMAFSFVDSCLAQASEGIFVGVGIVFLLWTILSLLDSVEETFNQVWGVTVDRSFFRKVTDYLAICIILPILMICSGGLQIFMSTAIQKLLPFDFLSPVLEAMLDLASYVLAWLFFVGAYMLIPNAKVRLSSALPAGILAGTAFQILQWLFVSGQLYVAKYNAIYGSFSFLPLMLIWMQLSWLITLAGALVCSSAQNISMFTYRRQTQNISDNYRLKVTLAVLSVIIKRFESAGKPITPHETADTYGIPSPLVSAIFTRLMACGLIVRVVPDGTAEMSDNLPVQPAMSINHYTITFVIERLRNHGDTDFIPDFSSQFPGVIAICDDIDSRLTTMDGHKLLTEL
ncbi:MAG: YihY/virulence factor BrkB family protein [Duncaniella sp.]|nr:YihY/virulence factor BrkB family protein [Bacteroides sp.]MDE6066417.1 YihY/virulence factor BrkB family protein [Duncaniella sp.]